MEDYFKKIEYYVMELGFIGEEFLKKEFIQIVLRNLLESQLFFKLIYDVMYVKDI